MLKIFMIGLNSAQSSDWVRIGTMHRSRKVDATAIAHSAQSSDWVRIGTFNSLIRRDFESYSAQSSDWVRIGTRLDQG